MPYSIQTKDGITLDNIPDDWQPTDQRLKSLVDQRRKSMQIDQEQAAIKGREQRIKNLTAQTPGEYDPQSKEFKQRYGAAGGMGSVDRVRANFGAGMTNFGLGAMQVALPKAKEIEHGITDESIEEKRVRDRELADSTRGGTLLQIAGEAAPSFVIPAGAAAKGATMLPKIGSSLLRSGVGSRVLPTMVADSAIVGGALGAVSPTKSDESVLGNAALGTAGGAAFPFALAGAGRVATPFVKQLAQRKLARNLGDEIDISPAAQKQLQKAIKESDSRIVDSPQSTSVLTQNPKLAQLELQARANPDFAPGFQKLDEVSGNAKWKALDDALGNDASLAAAKQATDEFTQRATPEIFGKIKPGALKSASDDLLAAVRDKAEKAIGANDKAGQQVFGAMARQLRQSDGSAQSLWNIRQNVLKLLEATPAPGRARAQKLDVRVLEAKEAIDATLNRVTGNKWQSFLGDLGGYLEKEGAERSGQQIRNAFFSEVLNSPRGATTSAGNPAVARASLERARMNLGTNKFGDRLDWKQASVVDQVIGDLRAEEILGRAKKSMTGGGGSMTAPLLQLMKKQGNALSAGWLTDIAQAWSTFGKKKQAEILNDILKDPNDALTLMRQAEKIKRPLTLAEKKLVEAARVLVSGPAALSLQE